MLRNYSKSVSTYFNEKDYDHSVIPIIGFGIQFTTSIILGFIGLWFIPYPKMFINPNNTLDILDIVMAMILQVYSSAILISFILEIIIIHPIVSHCLREQNIVPEKVDLLAYLRWSMLILLIVLILHG